VFWCKKGILKLPFRLFFAILREVKLFASGDSSFYDSPLNKEGIEQAFDLKKSLAKVDTLRDKSDAREIVKAVLRGESNSKSVICSSNLRRAIATTCIGLHDRWSKSNERIHVLTCLQEMSRNVDALALAPKHAVPDMSRISKEIFNKRQPEQVFDLTHQNGNKTLKSNGLLRMKEFCEWAFQSEAEYIIVGGHSLYFKTFFNVYLPNEIDKNNRNALDAKTKKIKNSGVVSFVLQSGEHAGKTTWRIDPSSVVVVHAGFEAK